MSGAGEGSLRWPEERERAEGSKSECLDYFDYIMSAMWKCTVEIADVAIIIIVKAHVVESDGTCLVWG